MGNVSCSCERKEVDNHDTTQEQAKVEKGECANVAKEAQLLDEIQLTQENDKEMKAYKQSQFTLSQESFQPEQVQKYMYKDLVIIENSDLEYTQNIKKSKTQQIILKERNQIHTSEEADQEKVEQVNSNFQISEKSANEEKLQDQIEEINIKNQGFNLESGQEEQENASNEDLNIKDQSFKQESIQDLEENAIKEEIQIQRDQDQEIKSQQSQEILKEQSNEIQNEKNEILVETLKEATDSEENKEEINLDQNQQENIEEEKNESRKIKTSFSNNSSAKLQKFEDQLNYIIQYSQHSSIAQYEQSPIKDSSEFNLRAEFNSTMQSRQNMIYQSELMKYKPGMAKKPN